MGVSVYSSRARLAHQWEQLIPWRDLVGRLAIVGVFGWQAAKLIQQWIATGQLSGLVYISVGAMVVFCTVFRRPAARLESSLSGRLVAVAGTFAPSAFRPSGESLLPDQFTAIVILVGLCIAVSSLVFLGRNFGIVAAHRGISQSGPYGVVRHPVYAGYILMHAGFVCANWSLWNVAVWLITEGAQIGRTMYEERVLRQAPEYATYMARVRWRLIPGVF